MSTSLCQAMVGAAVAYALDAIEKDEDTTGKALPFAAAACLVAAANLNKALSMPFCGELEEWVATVEAAAKKLRSRANWVALELEDLR